MSSTSTASVLHDLPPSGPSITTLFAVTRTNYGSFLAAHGRINIISYHDTLPAAEKAAEVYFLHQYLLLNANWERSEVRSNAGRFSARCVTAATKSVGFHVGINTMDLDQGPVLSTPPAPVAAQEVNSDQPAQRADRAGLVVAPGSEVVQPIGVASSSKRTLVSGDDNAPTEPTSKRRRTDAEQRGGEAALEQQHFAFSASSAYPEVTKTLEGKSFVFTGDMTSIGRGVAVMAVIVRGGEITSTVSAKTTWLVCGTPTDTGKLDDATCYDVPLMDETAFQALLRGDPQNPTNSRSVTSEAPGQAAASILPSSTAPIPIPFEQPVAGPSRIVAVTAAPMTTSSSKPRRVYLASEVADFQTRNAVRHMTSFAGGLGITGILTGFNIVLSLGPFGKYSRDDITKMIVTFGGVVKPTLSNRIHFAVVGDDTESRKFITIWERPHIRRLNSLQFCRLLRSGATTYQLSRNTHIDGSFAREGVGLFEGSNWQQIDQRKQLRVNLSKAKHLSASNALLSHARKNNLATDAIKLSRLAATVGEERLKGWGVVELYQAGLPDWDPVHKTALQGVKFELFGDQPVFTDDQLTSAIIQYGGKARVYPWLAPAPKDNATPTRRTYAIVAAALSRFRNDQVENLPEDVISINEFEFIKLLSERIEGLSKGDGRA